MVSKTVMNSYELKVFMSNRRFEFDQLWITHFSMLPPFDSMSATSRDKLKEVSWKIYLEGSMMTQIETEEMEQEKHYKNVNQE